MRAIDRRSLLAALAVPMALTLATSGLAAGQSEADESVAGTVVFWNGYGADGDEITTFRDEVLPAFQAAYPNVEVETQEIPYNDLRQKLVTGLAGQRDEKVELAVAEQGDDPLASHGDPRVARSERPSPLDFQTESISAEGPVPRDRVVLIRAAEVDPVRRHDGGRRYE